MTLSYTHDMRDMLAALESMPEPDTWEAKELLRWLELEGTDVQSDYVQAHLERLGCGGRSLTWWALETWVQPEEFNNLSREFTGWYAGGPSKPAHEGLRRITNRIVTALRWSCPGIEITPVWRTLTLLSPPVKFWAGPRGDEDERLRSARCDIGTLECATLPPHFSVRVWPPIVLRRHQDPVLYSGPTALRDALRATIAFAEQMEVQP